MKYVFFIFESKHRHSAFNNFIKIKKIKNVRFFDFSGPFLSKLGKFIYNLNLSENFYFISCDGDPFLRKKNSANIWFGGTKFKIPDKYLDCQNNFVTATNYFSETKRFIQFYPCLIKKKIIKKETKIVIMMNLLKINEKFSTKIWLVNKKILLNDLSYIETEEFWRNQNLDGLTDKEKQKVYINLKVLLRIELIKEIKKEFDKELIVVGNDLKTLFPDALDSNYQSSYIQNLYNRNICIDLLAKDGSECLYPRSIQIIENNGLIFQIYSKFSANFYEKYTPLITFNSKQEMIIKLKSLLSHIKNEEITDFFVKKFNSKDFNYLVLEKLFNIK